jgi:glycosyltransferase involved in cell wall biosynthesis
MRIMWHSVKPTIPSGYGAQSAIWVRALREAGHDLIYSSSAGGPQESTESFEGMTILPQTGYVGSYGNDIIRWHVQHWKPDVVWSFMDAWPLDPAAWGKIPWAAWVPVDSDPIMPKNMAPLRAARWLVAMSHFGEGRMNNAGFTPLYVPLAYDAGQYFDEGMAHARDRLSAIWKRPLAAAFIVEVISANRGRRKNFPAILQAWQMFSAQHSDALLYLHTDASGHFQNGENLFELAKLIGCDMSRIVFPDQYRFVCGMFGQDYLRLVHSAADVHLNLCYGEGFGLPILEAAACGCPAIVPDFGTAPQLAFNGWIVPGRRVISVPGAWQLEVEIEEAANALCRAHADRNNQSRRSECIAAARQYEIGNVMRDHMQPTLDRIAEEARHGANKAEEGGATERPGIASGIQGTTQPLHQDAASMPESPA